MQNRKRDIEVWNRLLDSMGEGKGGMFWENSIDVWDKYSELVHWEDPEGSGGEGGGRGIGMGNTCNSMADSCQCMAKTTTIL